MANIYAQDIAIAVLSIPLFAVLITLLFVFIAKSPFLQGRRQAILLTFQTWINRFLALVSLVLSLLLARAINTNHHISFNFWVIEFYLDALSVYFVLLVNAVAFFASWYVAQYFRRNAESEHEHYYGPLVFLFFFNLFHLTMVIVPMVDNLVILWMAIALTTFASTLLVSYQNQREALEAAWKYIMITTAGIVFALLGTLFMANAVNKQCAPQDYSSCLGYINWSTLAVKGTAQNLDHNFVILSFLFILVGYGTKAGLAPMHTWLPDGHGQAPSPVSALLSGVLLKSALYAILRFYTITNLNQSRNLVLTSGLLLFAGVFSLSLATPFILKQRNTFKRVLAYHSLEHMGIIAFGIGIGGSIALFGALLHALNHALTKALMFLTYQNVQSVYPANKEGAGTGDEPLTGVLQGARKSGFVLLLGGLGLVGSPPFNIFLSELIILWGSLQHIVNPQGNLFPAPFYVLAVVLFLTTIVMIFGGLVRHLDRLLLGRAPDGVQQLQREKLLDVVPLLLLLAVVLIFGIWIPTIGIDFPHLLNESVCIVQNGVTNICTH